MRSLLTKGAVVLALGLVAMASPPRSLAAGSGMFGSCWELCANSGGACTEQDIEEHCAMYAPAGCGMAGGQCIPDGCEDGWDQYICWDFM